MYNLGAVPLGYFKSYYPQTAVITFTKGSTTETITEANIMSGGLMVNRYSVSGKKIEIGSTIAAELNLKLDNRNGQYNSFSFEGGEMFVQIGIRKNSTSTQYYVPLGYFTVDETPQKRSIINITALDRMTKFDKEANPALFTANMTVAGYVNTCCTACGITLATTLTGLPNYNYTITEFPDYGLTYRQILQWCAALLGTNAYMDWNGQLRLEFFSDNNTGFTINQGDRYNSEIEENDITITGVHLDADDGNEYSAGTTDYVIDLGDNFLIQHDYQSVVTAIYGKIGGFAYRPFRCEMKPAPHLYPLDKIVFVDKQGVSHNTIITDYTFKMNGHTFVEGKGETLTTNTYDIPDLTPQAMAMLNREVSRATAAEGVLSSRITQTESDITSEVVRATAAEGVLSSRITQTESDITAKVSATGGTSSSFAWSLTASGFSLISNNTTVLTVTDSEATFKGKITATSGSFTGDITIGEGGYCTLKSYNSGHGNLGFNLAYNSYSYIRMGETSAGMEATIRSARFITLSSGDEYSSETAVRTKYITLGDRNLVSDSSKCPYGYLYGTWTLNGSSIATTSDENLKKEISSLNEKYDTLFANLRPVMFKYKAGTSNRFHTGFIAQEVKTAIESSELTTQDFAAYVEDYHNEESTSYLRYEEFIALCVDQIQKLQYRVSELEKE